ncbi:MAG: DUF1232 domain-containing protein [Leptolyngbyaceae cyanobacterium RU_5_1]|nr:DUF1232 domain-containing protein [Leptolyngbyaceae cyanobacterium RU_5_1]
MNDFLKNAKQFAGRVPFVRDAVALYFCMLDEQTPPWAKAAIAAALTYFLAPLDAIPDLMAGIGFADDAGIVATAFSTVLAFIADQHRKQAEDFLNS